MHYATALSASRFSRATAGQNNQYGAVLPNIHAIFESIT